MIEFKGTTEEAWMKVQGHRIKDIIPRLNEYRKNNSNVCPLTSGKRK